MKILLGVTSSISIYKVLNLIRLLNKHGQEVRVVMSRNATRMIKPIVFQSLSSNKVFVDNFNSDDPLIHITLAKWCDVYVVVPATANIVSKISHGIADDLVSTLALAVSETKRRIVVPAMNKEMWSNSIIQENIKKLKNHAWEVMEPEEGLFASKLEGIGKGRLPKEKNILYFILRNPNGRLKGKNILITAGATKEYIDSVRFISNDSSGAMGLSLGLACYLEGANVTFIHGEMKYKPIDLFSNYRVINTEQMLSKVLEEFPKSDILIMCAAVSDFRPKVTSSVKIPKETLKIIELDRTPDILSSVARNKKENQIVIGFALNDKISLDEYSRRKMDEKRLDMIIGNPIEVDENGNVIFSPMGNKYNKVRIITKNKEISLEGSKFKIAKDIVKVISENIICT